MNLLRFLTGFYAQKDHSQLLLHPANAAQKRLAKMVYERYCGGEVLEYELGCAEFAGLWWVCAPSTLVPRDDSLVLLSLLAKHLATAKSQPKCLEIGAGTGVLSICLELAAANRLDVDYLGATPSFAHYEACDISSSALEIARLNAAAKRSNVRFLHADFADLDFCEYDVVFSNPPYIANDYPLDERVRKEPASALFGGERGSEILELIIAKAAREGVRTLACEIGYDQAPLCEKLLKDAGYKAVFAKDFAGYLRAFIAHKIS